MLARNVITGWILFILIGSLPGSDPAPTGFVEGHVKIFPLSDVNLKDDGNAAAVMEVPYAEYPLIVRSRDGQKEIARVSPDAEGNYRLTLPPGDYVMDVDRREHGHVRAKSQAFTIIANQTVRVDVNIDTGIR
jgi:hypothetical protein